MNTYIALLPTIFIYVEKLYLIAHLEPKAIMMMMEQTYDTLQLMELKKVLNTKIEIKIEGTDKEKNAFKSGVDAAIQLVTKVEKLFSIESKTIKQTLLSFNDESADDKKAFLLLLDYLFCENSTLRSECYTLFEQIAKPPSSINFLSDEMTFKLTGKEGTYNAWMTSEIRKGNQDALKTWNILIRMMGKAIHQTGPGVQVKFSNLYIGPKT